MIHDSQFITQGHKGYWLCEDSVQDYTLLQGAETLIPCQRSKSLAISTLLNEHHNQYLQCIQNFTNISGFTLKVTVKGYHLLTHYEVTNTSAQNSIMSPSCYSSLKHFILSLLTYSYMLY